MASSDLQKRVVVFLIISTVSIFGLIAVPVFEHWLQTIFFPPLGWQFEDGWRLSAESARHDVMAPTYAGLIEHFFRLLKVVLAMALVVAIVRFIAYLVFGRRGEGQREITTLLRTVLSIVIYVIAFAIIFQGQYPSINLGSIFAGSAIFGIVVGLALQDTLGNLFAGIALQADQPFQIGDVVNIPNRGVGVVEGVSWRGVKIRTFQNKLLLISNSVLGKELIEIAPKGNLNARVVQFNTVYSNSPAKTIQAVRDAVRLAENVSQMIRPKVRIRNFGDSSIDWEVKYWLDDYSKHNDTDALVRQRIWYAFQREKIDFAFPTRTIHIERKLPETAFEEHVNIITEHLNKVDIFAPLSDEETDRLAKASRIRVYAPGEAIVRTGQEGNSMFVILRGSVDIQITQNGATKILNRLRENDFFGEMSLFTGEPRTATVVAVEETQVLRIGKEAVKQIFNANPELVNTISDLVEERRELLRSLSDGEKEIEERKEKRVLSSIRRFFGLK